MTDADNVILNLPSLPRRRDLVTPSAAREIEQSIASVVGSIDNIADLQDWHAKAEALARYLKDKDARSAMWGAARRCEARIGQLLGHTIPIGRDKRGRPVYDKKATLADVSRMDRTDFRILALAVEYGFLDYTDDANEHWHSSRRAMVNALAPTLRGMVEAEFLGDEKGSQKDAVGGNKGGMETDAGVEFSVPMTEAERVRLYAELNYLKDFYATTLTRRNGGGERVTVTLSLALRKSIHSQWLHARKLQHAAVDE